MTALEGDDRRWMALEAEVLEACVLRAEGREEEAVAALQHRVSRSIREWSTHCGLEREVVQARLRKLLADTQRFVARGMAQRRIITASAPELARPRAPVAARQPVGLRHSVPVDDITGMLDGLAEAEREARRETVWPLRSRATFHSAAAA